MFELVLFASEDDVEPVSDALMAELDALSVSVEDADALGPDEQALFGEPGMPVPQAAWRRSVVRALFALEKSAVDAAALLLAQPWAASVRVQGIDAVPDDDWVRRTQAQFAPVEITPEFWIVPSWHEPPARASTVIRLDPGLAFGTGTHATTRMCLRWLARQPRSANDWDRVLDYGCGSGILAIAARLLGAAHVEAVDIDPAAIEATLANAAANGATVHAGAPETARGDHAVVLANILAVPLKLLAPALCDLVRPGGHLVLAGILERQADELRDAYAPWIALDVSDREDGWILMTGQRASLPRAHGMIVR